MTREELLERYNNFYQYYSHENFINMMFDYEQRKQNQENLIKYIEDKIKEIKDERASYGHLIDKDIWYEFDLKISGYQDILERIKNNNYES